MKKQLIYQKNNQQIQSPTCS